MGIVYYLFDLLTFEQRSIRQELFFSLIYLFESFLSNTNNMKIKIANIVIDDKFIDLLFDSMALLNDKWENDYLLVSNNKPDSYKYIKNADRIFFVPKDAILDYLVAQKYDAVFLHSLPSLPIELIPEIDKTIKVFWFAWGWDIYQLPKENPFIPVKLIKKETQKELDKLKPNIPPKKKTLKDYFRPLKYLFFDSPSTKNIKNYYEAIKRIDYFSGILDFEYDLMKSVKGFKAKRVTFKYASLHYLENSGIVELYHGHNILIGNSAASTNNHLDIIPYINKINLGERKIILPLSYSNSKEYIEDIANAYHQEFGDSVIVLKDFLSAQEYSDLLLSCSVAIFFMERQQAMGNINGTLLRGCKVFLSETNPVYNYYKNLGVKLFSIQKDLNQSEITSPLTLECIEKNRDVLSVLVNKEKYIQDMNYIYDCIVK